MPSAAQLALLDRPRVEDHIIVLHGLRWSDFQRLLEARGDPVVVRSPSTDAHARCQRLKYDIAKRKISLDGEDEVQLYHQSSEIHAPALEYEVHPVSGRLGTLWADGPGWVWIPTEAGEELFRSMSEAKHQSPALNATDRVLLPANQRSS